MPRSLLHRSFLLVLPLLLPACGDDATGTGDAGAGDAVAGDALAGDALADAAPPADAAPCETTLCGTPSVCCPAESDCIGGQCLPTCASGVRCGADLATCCSAGQVCLAQLCATPGASCSDSYDCVQPGEFCEPTLGQCLPQPDPLTCEVMPTFTTLDATVEWSFETDQIISIPVVANLDGVGPPEVVVNLTQQDGLSWPGGNIAVLSGATGIELLRVPHDPANGQYGSHGRSTIALGDVSGDGRPDIIYAARPDATGKSLVVAIDGTGNLLWTSHDAGGLPYVLNIQNGAATLANLDDDPEAEIVFGAAVLDNDGLVVWDEGGNGAGAARGTNAGYTGGISAVADLDGDGVPEIISGRDAWKVAWTPGAPPQVTLTSYWTYAGNDGFPAVADLDLDGQPEVVLVASRQVIVLNGQTGELFCGVDPTDAACVADPGLRTQPAYLPGATSNNRGGPPTIADFDADGRPEIGVAGGYAYSVYDLNRPGEEIVQPLGDPVPAAGALYIRWSNPTQDLSSNVTGSSVFDFQGDGAAEVVYGDECFTRVYSGVDGTVQLEIPSTSATIHEYPLVVDVDGDGNSEILIVANQLSCPGQTAKHGLFVYGDVNDQWVPTRRVWTQHAYHVTNAQSDGNVPFAEADNWTLPGLNNYRQNVQGDGVWNAPDLTVDLSVGLDRCGSGEIVLLARVANVGALGVAPGVPVEFFLGTDATGTPLGAAATAVVLLPGASTVVSLAVAAPLDPTAYFVRVNGDGSATVVPECDASNNDGLTTEARCPVVD
jgi:hypothetical protein